MSKRIFKFSLFGGPFFRAASPYDFSRGARASAHAPLSDGAGTACARQRDNATNLPAYVYVCMSILTAVKTQNLPGNDILFHLVCEE